ncbi:MAG: DUF4878 domain-containing protein [Clostridiales bacterium]|jgi:hypothetical protein|nr:DUF4878 domain-containing protein [Clostridiales bacterium]
MKKTLCLGLAIAMALGLAGCAQRESAQSVVQKAIDSVKTMDVETMQSYWGNDQFKDIDNSGADAESDDESLSMMTLFVKNLDYQIIESNEEKETATVKVQITNLDMSSIMSEFMSEAFKEALSYAFLPEEQRPTDEDMNKMSNDILTNLLEREDNPKVTNTVDITLSLRDNQWVINPSADAVDAMLGGISSFSETMNNAFSGID